jgi:predicted flavoprotein YhiN
LKEAISAVSESPNCAEVLSKYRSKDITDVVTEIKVKWLGHDAGKRLFPKETILTDVNVEPVLRMMADGKDRDVLDVTIVTKPVPGSASGQ